MNTTWKEITEAKAYYKAIWAKNCPVCCTYDREPSKTPGRLKTTCGGFNCLNTYAEAYDDSRPKRKVTAIKRISQLEKRISNLRRDFDECVTLLAGIKATYRTKAGRPLKGEDYNAGAPVMKIEVGTFAHHVRTLVDLGKGYYGATIDDPKDPLTGEERKKVMAKWCETWPEAKPLEPQADKKDPEST